MSPGHKMRFTGRLLMTRWLLFIVYPPCPEYIDMGNDKMILAGIQVFELTKEGLRYAKFR
jgi:hypothetical protein